MVIAQVQPIVHAVPLPHQRDVKVPCCSIFLKMACLIPIIGSFVQYLSEKRIKKSFVKIYLNPDQAFRERQMLRHLKAANSFLKCGMARDVLSLALAITAVVSGVIILTRAFGVIFANTFTIAYAEWNIQKNKKTIEKLSAPTLPNAVVV